jgi:hypothetical protein
MGEGSIQVANDDLCGFCNEQRFLHAAHTLCTEPLRQYNYEIQLMTNICCSMHRAFPFTIIDRRTRKLAQYARTQAAAILWVRKQPLQ